MDNNILNYAQITSDLDKSGDSGDSADSGGVLRNLSLMPSPFSCRYCNYQGKSENDVLVHLVNAHPGKPAQSDETNKIRKRRAYRRVNRIRFIYYKSIKVIFYL